MPCMTRTPWAMLWSWRSSVPWEVRSSRSRTVALPPEIWRLRARIWRRYLSGSRASMRSSASESKMRRCGFTSSTFLRMEAMVSASSTSEGWKTVYWDSGVGSSSGVRSGQRIEDEAMRLHLVDLFEDGGDGVGQFNLRGMEDRVLGFRREVVVGRNHLENLQAFDGPAMRFGDLLELDVRFRE